MRVNDPTLASVVGALRDDDAIRIRGNLIALPGHVVQLPERDQRLWDKVQPHLGKHTDKPPTLPDLAKEMDLDLAELRSMADRAIGAGLLVHVKGTVTSRSHASATWPALPNASPTTHPRKASVRARSAMPPASAATSPSSCWNTSTAWDSPDESATCASCGAAPTHSLQNTGPTKAEPLRNANLAKASHISTEELRHRCVARSSKPLRAGCQSLVGSTPTLFRQ